MKDLVQTLDSLISLLNRLSIEYVIMGGLVVRAYSIPRATEDIDLTISLSHERFGEFYNALDQHGFEVPEPYKSGWLDELKGMHLVKIKRFIANNSIDIDLFFVESRFQEEVMRRRRLAEVEDRKLWIASPEDLVLLKIVSGRTRDWVDVADIFFTQGELDEQYMRLWAKELSIEIDLERALAQPRDQRP